MFGRFRTIFSGRVILKFLICFVPGIDFKHDKAKVRKMFEKAVQTLEKPFREVHQ